jgi:uncharacterized membrane protein YgcG
MLRDFQKINYRILWIGRHEQLLSGVGILPTLQEVVGYFFSWKSLRQVFWAGVVILTTLFFAPASLAVPVEAVPNPLVNGGWVSDVADLLSDTTEATLNQLVSALNEEKGTEVAIVTVPDTSPSETPQQFASELFDRWNLDRSGEKPGVLLLISQRDRRIEIKTGFRAILLLPNDRVSHIIRSLIVPQFKQGKFEAGTLAGTEAIVTALQSHSSVSTLSLKRFPIWSRWILAIALFVGVPVLALTLDALLRPKLGTMSYQDYCNRYGQYYGHYYSGSGHAGCRSSGGCGGGGGYYGGGAGGSW